MYYLLDGKEPRQVDNLIEWAVMFQSQNRTVQVTKVRDIIVSTIFLGIDYSFGEGEPILFETMIFGGEHDQSQWRYSTWDEAKKGHFEAIKQIFEVPSK